MGAWGPLTFAPHIQILAVRTARPDGSPPFSYVIVVPMSCSEIVHRRAAAPSSKALEGMFALAGRPLVSLNRFGP